ncbi:uncharacterized protein DEA37_0012270 [Paragonimus westermani]|uniref:RRM domain-containing protein n=1 Tax=Paragonimus westermani TaxID=34504 RepID=A0A5J4NUY4_9TREM|nr:uncharacterized protein DEA37_0012270 [Paragonimus westermani]
MTAMSTGAYSALMSSKRKRDAVNGFIMNGENHAPMDTESNENKKIFYRYGKILRIITFLKNNQYHGLIEFDDHVHAFVAMLRVYPDALFTLFGVYGDVTRVKIMFNKKDTALVQFSDSQQALTGRKDKKMALVQLDSIDTAIQALIELHNSQLTENSHLRISFSKSAI